MTDERRRKLAWRWSLVTAGLIALFWTIYYLVNGSVPVVVSVPMTTKWTIQLPFGISRWWDILIGPIWSSILILLFTNEKIGRDEDLAFGLALGLGFGLVSELAFGLGSGLTFGLAFGLAFGLIFGPTYLVRMLASKNFWTGITDWLLAK